MKKCPECKNKTLEEVSPGYFECECGYWEDEISPMDLDDDFGIMEDWD